MPSMIEIKLEDEVQREEQHNDVVSSVMINMLDHMDNNVNSVEASAPSQAPTSRARTETDPEFTMSKLEIDLPRVLKEFVKVEVAEDAEELPEENETDFENEVNDIKEVADDASGVGVTEVTGDKVPEDSALNANSPEGSASAEKEAPPPAVHEDAPSFHEDSPVIQESVAAVQEDIPVVESLDDASEVRLTLVSVMESVVSIVNAALTTENETPQVEASPVVSASPTYLQSTENETPQVEASPVVSAYPTYLQSTENETPQVEAAPVEMADEPLKPVAKKSKKKAPEKKTIKRSTSCLTKYPAIVMGAAINPPVPSFPLSTFPNFLTPAYIPHGSPVDLSTRNEALDLCVRKPESHSKPIQRMSSETFKSVFQGQTEPRFLNHSAAKKIGNRAQATTTLMKFNFESYFQQFLQNGRKHYTCNVCDTKYSEKLNLKKHFMSVHINPRLMTTKDRGSCDIPTRKDAPMNLTCYFRCHVCPNAFFESSGHLREHHFDKHSSHHPMVVLPSGQVKDPQFTCEFCETTFTNKLNLLRHEALHEESRRQKRDIFPCMYCFFGCKTFEDRETHHAQHSPQNTTCMYLCGYQFKTLGEVRKHLLTSHKEVYNGCTKCQDRFVDAHSLDKHMLIFHSPPVHERPIITITTVEKEQPDAENYKNLCKTCNEDFIDYIDLCRHRKSCQSSLNKHKKSATSTVQKKNNKEDVLAAPKPSAVEEFSLPNLSAGKQTVALTREVTISALPPETEDRIGGPSLVILKVPDPQEALPKPIQPKKPTEKKKHPLKIILKSGNKSEKRKKAASKVKPKTVVTVIKKELPKVVDKSVEPSKEVEKPVEALKLTEKIVEHSKPVEKPQETPKEVEKPQETAVVTENATVAKATVEEVVEAPVPVKKELVVKPKSAKQAPKSKSRKAAPKAPKRPTIKTTGKPPKAKSTASEPAQESNSRPILFGVQRPMTPKTPGDLTLLSLDMQEDVKRRSRPAKRKQLSNSEKKPRKSSSRPTRNNPNISEDFAVILQSLELGQASFQVLPERRSRKNKKQSEMRAGEILEEGFTGDWTRPRRYICHVCTNQFSDLDDLDDHARDQHPNVLATYSDVPLDVSLPDNLFHRSLNRVGACGSAPELPHTLAADCPCTKCGKVCANKPDLHKHMLECGGDITWMLASTKRRKPWRPFNTRRRARRGMNRSPMSPVKTENKKRKRDRETIDKILSNMPGKRGSTRRLIIFNEDEIKTRSQATIHSLRPMAVGAKASKSRSSPKQPQPSTSSVTERRSSSESADKPPKVAIKSLEKTPPSPMPPINIKPKKALKTVKPAVAEEVEEPKKAEKMVEFGPELDRKAPIDCRYCEKGLMNFASLQRHLKSCSLEPKNIAKKQASQVQAIDSCPICYVTFTSSKLLERHASNCNESPSEITNRAKVFRKRASELSKLSDASSESVDAPELELDSNKPKRRKRGKGKPFFIRKNATKKNFLTVAAFKKAKSEDAVLKPKTKLKRELANLVILASEPTPLSRPKNANSKKAMVVEETLPVEPKEAEVAPEVTASESLSVEIDKLKKKQGKKVKKQIKSAAFVDSNPSSPMTPSAADELKVEVATANDKKDESAKITKESKKRRSEQENGEAPVKKVKKNKSGVSKRNVPEDIEEDLEDNIPLSQVIKKKKTAKLEAAASLAQDVCKVPLPEPKEKISKKKAASEETEAGSKKKPKLDLNPSAKEQVLSEESEEVAKKKKKAKRSDELKIHCDPCSRGFSTPFNYQKHLKTLRHLNRVKGINAQAETESSSESTVANNEGFSTAVNYLKTVEHLNDAAAEGADQPAVSENSVAESKEVEEISFPAIKEEKEYMPPPPPPNSPCPPDEEPEPPFPAELINSMEERTREVEEPKEMSIQPTPPAPDTVDHSDDEDEEEWQRPEKLPPPPKFDFDAVRDSVPNWTSKRSSFQPPSPPPVPPPMVAPPAELESPYVIGNVGADAMGHYTEPQAFNNPYLIGNFEGQQSLKQIQEAMGATDEDMAILENLGVGLACQNFVYDNSSTYDASSSAAVGQLTLVNLANATGPIEPLEDAELMDLDNQVTAQQMPEPVRDDAFIAAAKSHVSLDEAAEIPDEGGQMVNNSTTLLTIYGQKEMVCPMCNKHFLGLQAVETHIAWAHKIKETKLLETDGNNTIKLTDQVARERDCLLVGLAAANVLHHAGGTRSGVLRAAAGAVADECAQKKRKIACFVCKELYTDMMALNTHIHQRHVKSKSEASSSSSNGLKEKMTTVLGGLLDRALTNLLGKVPLPPVEKQHSESLSKDSIDPRTPLINLDTPLTLTAIAKQAIKPVSDKAPESDESLEAVINKMRKASTAPKEQPRTDDADRPPLFPENQDYDPILPERSGPDMQCPICVGVVKHFHSLCRHLKTQHTEWAVTHFTTELFHYLTLVRQNPKVVMKKKYLINVPGLRSGQQDVGVSNVPDESLPQSSGSAQPSDPAASRDEDIRIKAYAALQQLSTKTVRGSKRRPLDLRELRQSDQRSEPSTSGSSASS
ncbi:Hypothetical predicted protein [Cloeon dipterum]|uniref:C2H2-type domain-containing protein n=2 Tax=Cloeon dipterum TaxID=197152 RepID=A0A8S1CIK6_9INSE|nr:Hypothetical predicted protein [Cloeon dipterum]CAB3371289.1 Hypothetical predicted protein [Cloeon dipterum]